MSLEVHSLASGSSGNAMLVRGQHGDLLLDCGMPRSYIETAVTSAGSSMDRLRAIVLTHEHVDHARSALAMARRYRIPLAGSPGTLRVVTASDETVPMLPMQPHETMTIEEFTVTGYPVSHDAHQPFSFVVGAGATQMCYAVDLGRLEDSLLQACAATSLVVIEANHDRDRLMRGPYGAFLKDRILGLKGHLCNDEAARMIAEVSSGDRPTQFWLAHLSAVNNSPRTALHIANRALNKASRRHCAVEVAQRDRTSLHWSSSHHWWQPQLALAW
ncbi:MAG: MBL fold metallo-hydrolase [Armatimonadota bacterium]|nr:MBL fold metallo-hydrolase [Armatimonadota bacterium]